MTDVNYNVSELSTETTGLCGVDKPEGKNCYCDASSERRMPVRKPPEDTSAALQARSAFLQGKI